MNHQDPIGVLFICMGNICRSPVAEAVFLKLIRERNVASRFRVDSAGTGGWHAGERADARMRQAAAERAIQIESRARQVCADDFRSFAYLICMDDDNQRIIVEMGGSSEQVRLLMEFAPHAGQRQVPDPYYGGEDGFQTVIDLVQQGCQGLLDHLLDDANDA